jgi:hypothetical protein
MRRRRTPFFFYHDLPPNSASFPASKNRKRHYIHIAQEAACDTEIASLRAAKARDGRASGAVPLGDCGRNGVRTPGNDRDAGTAAVITSV